MTVIQVKVPSAHIQVATAAHLHSRRMHRKVNLLTRLLINKAIRSILASSMLSTGKMISTTSRVDSIMVVQEGHLMDMAIHLQHMEDLEGHHHMEVLEVRHMAASAAHLLPNRDGADHHHSSKDGMRIHLIAAAEVVAILELITSKIISSHISKVKAAAAGTRAKLLPRVGGDSLVEESPQQVAG